LTWLAAMAPLIAADAVGATGRAFAFVAIVGVGVAMFLLINVIAGTQSVERDLETRLSAYTGAVREEGVLARFRLLRRFVVRAERLAETRGVLGQIENALEQANLAIRPGEAIAGALAAAGIVGIMALVLTGDPIIAIVVGLLAAALAAAIIAAVASQQRRRFEEQLPDTLNLIATSLRAGYSMLQALEAVTQESPDPTAREFRRVLNEIRLGRSATEALQDSARRMESLDFDWVVLAFTIQREVGGNLAEVLQTTSETMLHRGRLRREMRALTAEGRISAVVLGSTPFVLFGFLFLGNRDYLEPMLQSRVGQIAIGLSLLLLAIGLVWLSRVIKVEV
jgi:tight adherence protein B